jgi:hypothetical protein
MKVIYKSWLWSNGCSEYSSEFWERSLTKGKEYDVLNTNYISSGEYMIMNDYGFEHLYTLKCFYTKQEIRDEKLNKILDFDLVEEQAEEVVMDNRKLNEMIKNTIHKKR